MGTAGADDRVVAELTARCAERALRYADPVERLLIGRTLRRCARRRTEPTPTGRWRRRVRRWRLLTAASHAVPRCVLLVAERSGPEPDAELRALLADAIALTRRAAGLPETAADGPAPEAWARACAILGEAGE